ncbi:MAG: hypothetical protein ACI9UV_000618 [Algoriphagus sp.]
MTKKFSIKISFLLLFFVLIGAEVKSQTYTSNANGNWNTASTWTITGTAGCGGAIPNTPPVATNNRPCPVIVIINHNVTGPNELTIGNNNQVTIQIAANRTLSINRSLSVTGFNNKSLTISGSGTLEIGRDFNVDGNINLSIFGDLAIKVDRRINVTQSAQFEADGTILFTSNRVIVDGNGALNFNALTSTIFETSNNQNFIIRNGSTLNFTGTSGINSGGDILITGNTPSLNLQGNSFLESSDNLNISNGANLTLEDQSSLIIGNNLELTNQATLTLNDQSSMNIDRNLRLNNQASLISNQDGEIEIGGDMDLNNQAVVAINDGSSLAVTEDVSINTNGGTPGLQFSDDSESLFRGDLTVTGNSSILTATNNSQVTIEGNMEVRGGASVALENSSSFSIVGNLTFDNNYSTEWTNSQSSVVLVEGDFSKGSRSGLDVTGSSIFEVCSGSFPSESSDPNINVATSPAYYGGCRILPVDYDFFEAEFNSFRRAANLKWATAKEWENDRFEVERSVNNVTTWGKIAVIEGAGYSDGPIEYELQDLNLPLAGGNIFYRLKQIDFDGTFAYSDTKSIQLDPVAGSKSWRVFPNQTTGNRLTIELIDPTDYRDEFLTLRIIAPSGSYSLIQVADKQKLSQKARDYFKRKAAGVYTLEISWGKKCEYHKLILRR